MEACRTIPSSQCVRVHFGKVIRNVSFAAPIVFTGTLRGRSCRDSASTNRVDLHAMRDLGAGERCREMNTFINISIVVVNANHAVNPVGIGSLEIKTHFIANKKGNE